ncbi:MAG: MBL fold metallo-hydrolase [Clostridia bacterium]|nr:MBL fold metallo-hydrolase [Clostridia bacterium]
MATKKSSDGKAPKKNGKSTTKANVNRVVKAAKKYDSSKNFKDNKDALAGVVAASAKSASRAANKKQKTFFVIFTVILIAAIVFVAVYGYFKGWFDPILIGDNTLDFNSDTYDVTAIKSENLSIHFLELGNGYTGDCVYIKAGETDVLIDAGSRSGSAAAIAAYVDRYCEDNTLEYVIATHAHQDHIAGFVGTKDAQGIFDKYECKTIIEFARTNATSEIYKNYCEKRNEEAERGANCYTALECVNNSNGAKKIYDLSGDGSITMEILYQKYYEQDTSNENNYSVCLLITQGNNNYLFTGDLEDSGETSLVNSNPDLPEVQLYKGGHHGSYTAASAALLHKIKPQCICICCCAGSVEYTKNLENTFPAQKFINRIAPYTDAVYVTTAGKVEQIDGKYKDVGYESLNGNIVYACTNGKVTMYFSNSSSKLKDTDWFKENRQCPPNWK